MALFSGALLTMAFPKFDQGWLAWCALVPLLLALRSVGPRAGFWVGFAFGMVHYCSLIYWTAYTMRVYGALPWFQAVFVLLLFAMVLSAFTGLFGWTVCLLAGRPAWMPAVAPAAWGLVEWLRTWIFTGFPWELLGYSQYDRLWVIQPADLFGVYGVSALIVLANAVLALALLCWAEKPWQHQPVPRRLVVRGGVVVGCLLLLTAGYGIYRMNVVDGRVAHAEHAEVAVVQGNIDQGVKWDPGFQMLTTAKYKELSAKAAEQGADLIVWPETATPFYLFHDKVLTRMVIQGIEDARVDFIIGSPNVELGGETPAYFNSAYLIEADGDVAGKYDKVHLVPFGEYVPFERWIPFIDKMVAQVGDFKAGDRGNTLMWRDHPVGMLICYEGIFPNLARAMAGNGARILVNITNDAWFGRTGAAYQHFSMAVFRSVENRRFFARAANTGISGFIDPNGRILAATELYQDAVLSARVALLSETTLYTRWGDWPLVIICLLLCAAAAVKRRSKRATGHGGPFHR
jgi:apolipoprotein N-acyltransferase